MQQQQNIIAGYNKAAKAYTSTFFHELDGKPLDRLLLKRFAEENGPKGKIADLGCGCGHTTKFLHDLGAKDLLGIDLSPNMIREANHKIPHLEFVVGNMLNLSFTDEYFAGIIAFYSIVHFDYKELEIALKEIHRVTEKGGQFLFSFHEGNNQKIVNDFLNHPVDAMTFYFFEIDKVLEMLKKIGWIVIDALIRYPYENKEFPSKRGYILCER